MSQLMNFFISNAYAENGAAQAQGGGFSLIIMFVVFFLFIYFAVWRPQSKKAREVQNLLSSLNKGDEVLTSGGILGRISKLSDQYITLTIANDVEIVLQKSAIITILPKGTLKAID